MGFSRAQVIFISVVVAIVVFFILVFFGFIPGLRNFFANTNVTLTVWGVYDDPRIFSQMINKYAGEKGLRTNITYQQIPEAEYEQRLIDALAAGTGPDVFMFHNTWLPKHFDKVVPFTEEQITTEAFRATFPTVIEQDFRPSTFTYALPLYLDTLVMFYNKDMFDAASIAIPPRTWEELQTFIPRLRQVDSTGRIIRAAAAIGGSEQSINRATDILNALMLQSGVQMVNRDYTSATFAASGGDKVLSFYTKFANSGDPSYTWHENLHYSIDNFAEGASAILFNYSHQIPILRDKNPFLNFAVAPFPQPAQASRPVTYANYWGLAAAVQSPNWQAAQEFVQRVTMDLGYAQLYSSLTGRPPAVRSLIDQNINDPVLGVFARQALTARSWPQPDNNVVESAFSRMIQSVISGRLTPSVAAQTAQNEISAVIQKQ